MKLPAIRFTEMMSHHRGLVYETRMTRKFWESELGNITTLYQEHYLSDLSKSTPGNFHLKFQNFSGPGAVRFINYNYHFYNDIIKLCSLVLKFQPETDLIQIWARFGPDKFLVQAGTDIISGLDLYQILVQNICLVWIWTSLIYCRFNTMLWFLIFIKARF